MQAVDQYGRPIMVQPIQMQPMYVQQPIYVQQPMQQVVLTNSGAPPLTYQSGTTKQKKKKRKKKEKDEETEEEPPKEDKHANCRVFCYLSIMGLPFILLLLNILADAQFAFGINTYLGDYKDTLHELEDRVARNQTVWFNYPDAQYNSTYSSTCFVCITYTVNCAGQVPAHIGTDIDNFPLKDGITGCPEQGTFTADRCTCPSEWHIDSPQIQNYIFQQQRMDDSKQYCDIEKTALVAKDGDCGSDCMDVKFTFNILFIASVIFLIFSGCMVTAVLTLRFRVILGEFKDPSSTLWNPERTAQDKDLIPGLPDAERRQDFGMLICFSILMNMIEDVPQCILGVYYLIYMNVDYGSECVQMFKDSPNLSKLKFSPDGNVWELSRTSDPTFTMGFVAFTVVFITGCYGIKFFRFKLKNVPHYKCVTWSLWIFLALTCGFIYMMIIGAPVWFVLWHSVPTVLDMKEKYKELLLYAFLGGIGSWALLLCVGLCVGNEECDCCSGD